MTAHTKHSPLLHPKDAGSVTSILQIENQLETNYFNNVIGDQLKKNTDAILQILSYKVSNFWGYEVRLLQENPPDLLICVSERNKMELLNNIQATHLQSEEWNILKCIVNDWMNLDILAENILNIWLEFDQKGPAPLNPNFFFAPNPVLDAKSLRSVCESIFNTHLKIKLSKDTLDFFEFCIRKLPYQAWAPQVGMMLARNKSRLRTYIHKVPAHGLAQYLTTVGWRHVNKNFNDIVKVLNKFSDCVDLDIDTSETIGDIIGLECYFDTLSTQKLKTFLTTLCELGYANKEISEKLIAYHKGTSSHTFNTHKEFLHHIKITYNPQGPCEAKAYLGIRKIK